jgi:hypothetical protein
VTTKIQLINELNQIKSEEKPSTEPAVAVGTISAGIASVLFIALKYVIPGISEDAVNAIILLVGIVLPIIVGWVTRGKVWSDDSVRKVTEEVVARAIENFKRDSSNKPGKIDPPTIIG